MSQKCSSLFYCELCDYKCSKQSVFNKHLSTAKHQKITNGNNNVPLTCKRNPTFLNILKKYVF